ncbi:hypothetical protein F5141DRAFT_1065251 [Pisolithus sp. B1]|nr:hypothetical protein F5141DRAFT_1065251 [Pisolithus sp. B1]
MIGFIVTDEWLVCSFPFFNTTIKATNQDGGLISKAQLHRNQQTTPPAPVIDIPRPSTSDNPFFDSPEVRCASELFLTSHDHGGSIVLIRQCQGQSPLTTGRGSGEHSNAVCVDSETGPCESPILRREPLGKEQICLVEHSGTSLDTGSCDLSGPKKLLHHEQRGSREHSDDVHVHLATVVTEASSSNFTPGPTQEPSEVLPTGGDTPTIQMTDVAGDSVISPEELHFGDNSINPDDIFDGSTFVVGRPSEAILDMIQEERELECLQKSGSFTGSIESTPLATVCKKCYELFKKEYCDTWQDILLKFKESMQYTETGKTLITLLKAHGIEMAFVMAGSIVNQDASLRYAYTMPGTEDFFMEHCHTDTDAIISHFKATYTCVSEAFHTNKKGKAKEHNDMGCNIVDLTSDKDDLVQDNRSDEQEDHNLVKRLITTLIESHSQSWASGKLFPWKQLPQKLGQNALDHRPYRLHFKFEPNSKSDPQLVDLLASKKAVIIGTPPLHDSRSSRAKRIFYNGKTDYDGPAHLPNPAKTKIKRQVGGRKTTNRTAEDDGHLSSSPSPIPRMLHSTMHKAAVGERDSSGKGAPKSMYGHRKVEAVVTMMAKKLGKQLPSIITIGDSSEPGETNIGVGEDASDNYAQLFLSDDEQGPSTCEHKVTKVPSQARTAPKKRLRIISLFNSDSSSEERLLGAITARDSSMKQLASSLESDTIQLPSPKVMNASPQTRLVTKKNKLWFISPLSSELSSEKELGSDPPRDEPNATSSKASIDHQQPSVEIHIKQSHSVTAPGKSLCAMKRHNSNSPHVGSKRISSPAEPRVSIVLSDYQCNCNSLNHISMLANQLPAIQYRVCHTLNTTLVNQWGMRLLYMKQAWNCNKMNFLSTNHFIPQHVNLRKNGLKLWSCCPWLGPWRVEGVSEPYITTRPHIYPYSILTFSLGDQGHVQIYPGTSKAESTVPSSAASARLLAVEEGYVGVSPGERGMEPEPPADELPGELYLEIISSRMYSRDDQFSYDGIPYHLSMKSRVFILPPPFTAHCYPAHGYANDPTIHWPPSAKGFGHHTNVPPPFYGAHETKYANVGGSHDLPVRAYRQTQVYDSPSNASALLGTQGGLEHSAGTCQDAVLDSTDPPAGSDIASTRDV